MDQILHTFSKLNDTLGSPISALLIIIIGWFIAGLIKKLIYNISKKTGIAKSLSTEKVDFAKIISQIFYLFIMIFVFLLALNTLGMDNVLEPVKNMLNNFFAFLPNVFGAGLVAYIGYMLATIVSELVALSGNTIQKLTPKLKLPENIDLVNILKKVVFIFIFVPLLITALNILKMDAISDPATAMLEDFFEAIPKIIVATIILIVFVVGGRFISEIIKDLLNSFNLNNFFNKASIDEVLGNNNIVKIIGNLVYFFIVLFGLITAVEKLDFIQLTDILDTILEYSSKIIFGLVILAIGSWIANIAANNFAKKENNTFLASIIKIAIISIFLAIGLKTMGIADDIINLAFGITLGTVALTIVLSFGLGGREAAGKQMTKILEKFNKK
ncbi:mechanosensitive ion channel [Polaribacter sp.]|uniref:mechanosensitive ion channel n=1 Tax=Polaribacter sp. TaxID=1920175 RepID=UPI003EF29B43